MNDFGILFGLRVCVNWFVKIKSGLGGIDEVYVNDGYDKKFG